MADPTLDDEENTPLEDRLSSGEDGDDISDPSQIGNFSKKKQEYMT